MIEEAVYQGRAALQVSDDHHAATITTGGPLRVFGFRRIDGPTLFADLPDVHIPAGDRSYPILGGHRLWIGPEEVATTYATESGGSAVAEHDDGVAVVAGRDGAGIVKGIRLIMSEDRVMVEHTLINAGDQPLELAPWAITQLSPGGRAFLPLNRHPVDQHGLQACDRLVLWPYTDLREVTVRADDIEVTTERSTPTKGGVGREWGWLAYRIGDEVFAKTAQRLMGTYLDQGAAGQCYCEERFLELETLGPAKVLATGESVMHVETWLSRSVRSMSDEEMLEHLPQ